MIRPNGRGQFEGFNSMIVRLKGRRDAYERGAQMVSIL